MVLSQRKNGRRMVFSEASYKVIGDILSELISKSRARVALFADSNGYPIVYDGNLTDIDLTSLTALAAGTFSATAEMARMLSEPEAFKFIYHEGEQNNSYLSRVDESYILVIIFDTRVALGMIRVYTNRAVEKLNQLLANSATEDEDSTEILDLEFRTLLGQELDKSFGL